MKKAFSLFLILFLAVCSSAYAATKDLVPRATGEGSLGDAVKKWDGAHINDVTVYGTFTVEGTIADASGECSDGETLVMDSGAAVCGTAGGGSSSGKEYYWPASALLPLEAADSIPPINKIAGTNIDLLTLDFNDSTDECRAVSFKIPATINTGGTATFGTTWRSAAATSGNLMMDFRHNSGISEGTDPDQSLTTEAAAADAVQGTVGQLTFTTWTETMSNLGWAAGQMVVGVFCRDANHASDTLAGDSQHVDFWIIIP